MEQNYLRPLPKNEDLIAEGARLQAQINHDLKVAVIFTACCAAWTIGSIVTGYRWYKKNR